ncbi:MAG: DMT family transporter [Pseudomonadota bacterium]
MKESAVSVKKSLVQINLCVLLLGGTTLFAKLITLPADVITLYRSIVGVAAILILIFIARLPLRLRSTKDYVLMVLVGLLTGAHWVTFFGSIQMSTVAIGIISLYTFPIMTSLLEPLFEREKIQLKNIFRALIVFVGILLIIPKFEISNQMTSGVLLGLFSALLFSIRNIVVRKTLNHVNGVTSMGYQLFVVILMFLPFVEFKHDLMVDNRLPLMILLGIAFTAAPHALLVSSLGQLKAATASLILCLQPMYSILFAAALISEIPSFKVLLGGALIVGISIYESNRVRQGNKS